MGVGNILSNNMFFKIRLEKFLKKYISSNLGQGALAEVMSEDDLLVSNIKQDFIGQIFEIIKDHSSHIYVRVNASNLDIKKKYLSKVYLDRAHDNILGSLVNNITTFTKDSYIEKESRISNTIIVYPINIELLMNKIIIESDKILYELIEEFKSDFLLKYTVEGVLDDMILKIDNIADDITTRNCENSPKNINKKNQTVFLNRVHPSAPGCAINDSIENKKPESIFDSIEDFIFGKS